MAKKKTTNSNRKKSSGCQKHEFSGNVWCDDFADVYIGTKSHVKEIVASQNHFDTVSFKGAARCCDYLYFVCWSNDIGQNGLLAEVQGGNIVRTGDSNNWEVFATGIDKDQGYDRPIPSLINSQLGIATWVNPFVGANNNGAGTPWSVGIPMLTSAAKFIWHNSGNDTAIQWPNFPFVPFKEFNHNEFLIFRFPINRLFKKACKDCDCCDEYPLCSSVCLECTEVEDSDLTRLKNEKHFQVEGNSNGNDCANVISGEPCSYLDLPKIRPCFYFNWGDSTSDQIETHDTEIVYITVCNPYENIGFKGLTISRIDIVPPQWNTPSGNATIRITPSKMINFNCLDACSCKTREFALITRGAMAQGYTINVEYCIDEIIVKGQNKGTNSFNINLIDS